MTPETPEPIRRLDQILLGFTFRHELAIDAHLTLTGRGGASEASADLLRESAVLAVHELASLLNEPQALGRRWSDQELLDPAAATATLGALSDSLDSIAAELEELRARHNAIVRAIQMLLRN